MNDKIKDIVVGVCTLVEVGCVLALGGIALKRNKDCYDAECALVDEKLKHGLTQLKLIDKDYEIAQLKAKLRKSEKEELGVS